MSMRFVSPHAGYQYIAKHNDFRVLASGLPVEEPTGYICQFRKHYATDYELDVARKTFQYKTPYTRMDGTPIDPVPERTSLFDTSWIEDERLRELVEQKLLRADSYGIELVRVETPRRPAPWPTYDDLKAQGRRTERMVGDQHAETARLIGVSLDEVVAYERDNQNRPGVIEGLEAAAPAEETEEEFVEA